jgi:hypothetical protein
MLSRVTPARAAARSWAMTATTAASIRRGESFRSLARRTPRILPQGRVADVTGGRPPTDADFWRQQRALTMPGRPPQ